MKDTELKRERDKDLYQVYKKALRDNHFSSMMQAADFCRRQPARSYYIDSREAQKIISLIEKGVSLIGKNSHSRKRAWDLYELVKQYREQHPGQHKGLVLILEEIVCMEAPEFYLSGRSAKRIILNELRRERQRRF